MQRILKSFFSQVHVSASRRSRQRWHHKFGRVADISRVSAPEVLENRTLLAAQAIASDTTTKTLSVGQTIEIPVIYRTLDNSDNPAALQSNLISFNLHFDADALTFVNTPTAGIFQEGIQVVPNATRLESDATVVGNDNDAATETVLVATYSDSDFARFLGWPNDASASVSGARLVCRRVCNPFPPAAEQIARRRMHEVNRL